MPGSWHHLGTELRSCCWQSTGDGRQQTCTGQGPAPPGIRDHQEEQPLALGHLHKPSPAGKPRLREPVTPRQSLAASCHSTHPVTPGQWGHHCRREGLVPLLLPGAVPSCSVVGTRQGKTLPQTANGFHCHRLAVSSCPTDTSVPQSQTPNQAQTPLCPNPKPGIPTDRQLCALILTPKPGTDTSVP